MNEASDRVSYKNLQNFNQLRAKDNRSGRLRGWR